MSDDTVTGWRTRALRIWAWLLAHPDACFVAIGLLMAFLLGVWVG